MGWHTDIAAYARSRAGRRRLSRSAADTGGREVARPSDLSRINAALDAALSILSRYDAGALAVTRKQGGDPVTEADEAVDAELRRILPSRDEGWLSEESADDPRRLSKRRVWVVDPIDGTREFLDGIPEWCVSIGLIEDGKPVAGGIHNPATGERIAGSVESGVAYEGHRPISGKAGLDGALIGASRSECMRGEWEQFGEQPFEVVPMGSIAYKLALVAVGRLDATWTLVPKSEWDVAGGAALVQAAGGWVAVKDGSEPRWNSRDPRVSGFVASSSALRESVESLLVGPPSPESSTAMLPAS